MDQLHWFQTFRKGITETVSPEDIQGLSTEELEALVVTTEKLLEELERVLDTRYLV